MDFIDIFSMRGKILKSVFGVLLVITVGAGELYSCENFRKFPLFKGKKVKFLHLVSNLGVITEAYLSPGDSLGVMQKLPEKFVKEKNDVYTEAVDLYNKKDYVNSLQKFLELYLEEEDNLFLTAWLGKVYYTMGRRDNSFRYYSILIEKINQTGNPDGDEDVEVIDMWFLEAYWKIGTLLMDKGMYKEAMMSIRKMFDFHVAGGGTMGYDEKLVEQAYSYLTEAAYFLKEYELNGFYYCKTKEANADNVYVDKYKLNKIIDNEAAPVENKKLIIKGERSSPRSVFPHLFNGAGETPLPLRFFTSSGLLNCQLAENTGIM